ncbi:MAG: HypC/HybG/HupF family hydrogenase formation chaperone [Ignisphaera sp.]
MKIMCWGTPAVVVYVDEESMTAKVDFGDGMLRDVVIGVASERISRGDIVLVHAGVIISKLSAEGILEHIAFLREVLGEEFSESYVEIYRNIVRLAEELKK